LGEAWQNSYHKYSNFLEKKLLGITPEELFGENVGKKMRDSIINDYLSKSGDMTTQNSLEIVKEGLIEILKRI